MPLFTPPGPTAPTEWPPGRPRPIDQGQPPIPFVRSVRTQSTGDSSVKKPTADLSGGQIGDVCVVFVGCDEGNGNPTTTADGSNWTKRWDSDIDSTANIERLTCWTKTLSGAGTVETFSLSVANQAVCHAYVLLGVPSEIPTGKGGSFASGTDHLVSPSVTGLVLGNYLTIWAHGRDDEWVDFNFGTGLVVGPTASGPNTAVGTTSLETAYAWQSQILATGSNTCGSLNFKQCQGLTVTFALFAIAPLPFSNALNVKQSVKRGYW